MAQDETESLSETSVQAGPENPAGQKAAPAATPLPPGLAQKRIEETAGGKITNFTIFYGLGWVLNAAMSILITYGFNPRPGVKTAKDRIAKSIAGIFGKNEASSGTLDTVRSAIEINFMMIAGSIAAGIMTPLLKYQGRISHKINKMLGKDVDVLPEEMQKLPEPKTVEERIEQEIKHHTNKGNASIAALWLSRIGVVVSILIGDAFVNRGNRMLESKNLPSIDTLSWGAGKEVYKIMPKSAVSKWDNWFRTHGAGLSDIKASSPEHFDRIKTYGKVGDDNSSMVISEQTRLLIKEVGWSLVAAKLVDKMTASIRNKLMGRQVEKAINTVTREGLVPDGHRVIVGKDGKVSLDRVEEKPHELEPGYWAAKEDKAGKAQQQPAKSESHAQAVTNSKAAAASQQTLNT